MQTIFLSFFSFIFITNIFAQEVDIFWRPVDFLTKSPPPNFVELEMDAKRNNTYDEFSTYTYPGKEKGGKEIIWSCSSTKNFADKHGNEIKFCKDGAKNGKYWTNLARDKNGNIIKTNNPQVAQVYCQRLGLRLPAEEDFLQLRADWGGMPINNFSELQPVYAGYGLRNVRMESDKNRGYTIPAALESIFFPSSTEQLLPFKYEVYSSAITDDGHSRTNKVFNYQDGTFGSPSGNKFKAITCIGDASDN